MNLEELHNKLRENPKFKEYDDNPPLSYRIWELFDDFKIRLKLKWQNLKEIKL